MTRSLASILTALVAAAVLVVAAAPASASFHNERETILPFPPSGKYAMHHARLTLHGRYRLTVYGAQFGHPQAHLKSEVLTLNGRYALVDRLTSGRKYYRHYGKVVNVRTGSQAQLTHLLGSFGGKKGYFGFRWGSSLRKVN